MTEVKRNTFIITGIGILGIILTIYFFKESDKTLPNYATVIGTICSLIGLAIAYVNIVALKKASILMTSEIKNTLQKVNQLNSVSEISKAIKTNQEIQQYLRSNKIELAHLRTLDLKYMLLHFNSDPNLAELTVSDTYKRLVIEFGIDLNSINDNLINPKRKVDFFKIVNNLEELSTFLTQFETKLKTIKI
ncbi:MAG: hypothetical protein QM535_22305 [Limnohabitans sp.]|nr:hypothetical protein [Limnohabitans sp.]